MLERIPYDRRAAVAYAHQWAYGRNPDFYDYEEIGGDCTNFASQCLYAGTGVMNFNPVYGWFYRDPNDKARPGPVWSIFLTLSPVRRRARDPLGFLPR